MFSVKFKNNSFQSLILLLFYFNLLGLVSFHFHSIDFVFYENSIVTSSEDLDTTVFSGVNCPIQNFSNKTPQFFGSDSQDEVFLQKFNIGKHKNLSTYYSFKVFEYNLRAPPF
jgi:hypothetical protein